MTVLERLKTELNNKDYFEDATYIMYLSENELLHSDNYDKKTMQRNLLMTCVDILEAVANDVDMMRKVGDGSTNFTTGEAYKYLKDRINDIKQRIATIPEEEEYSNIHLLFTRRA